MAAAAALAVASTAQAIPVLDFNLDAGHGATASVSYAGGGAPLIGTDLSVDNVIGLDTPLNDTTILTISGGLLNFETGGNTGGYTWGANPDICASLVDLFCSVTITGGVAAAGIAPGTTLLAGRITGAQIAGAGVVLSTFVNFVHEDLAGFYGLPGGDTPWTAANTLNFLLINFNHAPGTAFTCATTQTDCRPGSGDLPTTPAPEPGTLLLLGSGLFASAAGMRRKLAARRAAK
jgi:hypothetical protein